MNIFKEFIQHLRRRTLKDVHLYIIDDTVPKLKNYIRLIIDVPFIDGAYHTYYGEIKKIVNSFMGFLTLKMDETIKKADRLSNVLNKQELVDLIQKTISIYQNQQIEFGKEYLPVSTITEKQNYEDIEEMYNKFMTELFQLKMESEKIDSEHKINEFSKTHFQISIKETSKIFEFAHVYLSMMLSDRLYQIQTSLHEIALRLRNNLHEMKDMNHDRRKRLLNQLYDKNKEQLTVNRRNRKSSTQNNEVLRGMEIIRSKIENNDVSHQIERLEEEVSYWDGRISDFNKIADTLIQLKAAEDNIVKQHEQYKTMRTIELPGTKYNCWENIGKNLTERREYLKMKIIETAKALRTLFSCKGIDRIYYEDNFGPYYVDEFNHQVYVTDYAMKMYHKDCEGRLEAVKDEGKYYFDKEGRYIIDDNQKIYQCAPCTSKYKLADDLLLHKITKDCGHSGMKNDLCRLDIKDPNIVEILPSVEQVNIKKSLDSEVVKYLWDSFGAILPEALHDVGLARPVNAIHYLAHKLLYNKYRRTTKELCKESLKAEDYRAKIYQQRSERIIDASQSWKTKQVKRRKPEESDDAHNTAIFKAQLTHQDFVHAVNFYNF